MGSTSVSVQQVSVATVGYSLHVVIVLNYAFARGQTDSMYILYVY